MLFPDSLCGYVLFLEIPFCFGFLLSFFRCDIASEMIEIFFLPSGFLLVEDRASFIADGYLILAKVWQSEEDTFVDDLDEVMAIAGSVQAFFSYMSGPIYYGYQSRQYRWCAGHASNSNYTMN